MRHLIGLYQAMIRVELTIKVQYHVNTFIWLVGLLIEPVVYLSVWVNVALAQGGSVQGYTPQDFAAYYLTFLVVRHFTIAPSAYRLAARIRDGSMSTFLLRPIHPIHEDVVEINTHKLISIPALVVIVILVSALFQVRLNTEWWAIVAFPLVVLLAGMLRFIYQWTYMLIAFWTVRFEAPWGLYNTAHSFLGGAVAPLNLLPLPLQVLSFALPFRWVFNFPVELLIGNVSWNELWSGILAQCLWIAVSLLALRVLWPAAVKRYAAVGG
jgi:ABC-2 type transport system permease protein